MRRLGQLMAVLVVLAVSAGFIHASGTDAQKCAASKIKAASKKISAKLKCMAKAVSKGEAVDATCLSKADTKFNTAVGKAEAKGGCAFTGDGPTFEALVDNDANTIKAFADPNALVCCDCPSALCAWAVDAATCIGGGCTPGATGTVCDGATGNCITPPATPGPCCSNPLVISGIGKCLAIDSLTCTGTYSGTPDPNSICPPDGGTCVRF